MKTKLTPGNAILYACEFVISCLPFGFFFSAGLIQILQEMGIKLDLSERKILFIFIFILASITFIISRYKQYKRLEAWELTQTNLHRGNPANLSVDLSKVVRVIRGLPKSKYYNFWYGGKFRFKEQGVVEATYCCTLILKLEKNIYLPLYLFDYGKGDKIMQELANRLSDKIDNNYTFNQLEKKKLKRKFLNQIIEL